MNNSTARPCLCSSLSSLAQRQATICFCERERGGERNAVTSACEYSNMPEMSNSKPPDCRAR